jgi:HEAT repeat protein
MAEWGEFPGAPGPDFVVPDVPGGVAYVDIEDALARSLLQSNGVGLDKDALLAALNADVEVIQAAAARVLGDEGEHDAIPRLRELAVGTGDSVRAEAGYALARLGDPAGKEALRACLELPVEAYVVPMQAAGALARLGDPEGAPVIERALRSRNALIRMVACKQLIHFVRLDGMELGDGRRLDAFALFDLALADRDPEVVQQARVQLMEIDAPQARQRLAR